MTAERTCDLPPFLSPVVAQVVTLEQAGSALEILTQTLENYLAQLRSAVCDDLTEIVEECCGGGGAESFLDLSDTPDSYAGAAGQAVVVNGGETGLEFVPFSAGAGLYLDFETTEQTTPRLWTGGETVYQKTVLRAGNLSTGATTVAHNITNLSTVLFMHAMVTRSNGSQVPVPFASPSAVGFNTSHSIDATNITINVGASWSGAGNVLSDYRCTLFYLRS